MTTLPAPVIFLAFANDRDDPARNLRNLAEEARQAQVALAAAEQRGHCALVLRQNATAGDILDVFQDARYRDRIAIFHFGGHADGYRLLLETAAGAPAAANAGGLARFLARQRGLQLVFLNGCSTAGQVADLLAAGVPAVIATDQAVDDAAATAFSGRFYRGLAGGAAIGAAFEEAKADRQLQGAPLFRHMGAVEQEDGDRIPWRLHYREGAAAVAGWSLPLAAADPLFGLPDLPPLDLPDKPYRYLDWYRREDAPVFFGRGREIRELYNWVTAPGGPPLVLFYGQSGVGKSSLLAAGLLPRLEASYTVRYVRRDRAAGLLGTLEQALDAPSGSDLAAAWGSLEAQAGRPLLVVLDQAEEVFTRPHPQQPDELAHLLDGLAALFSDAGRRLQGRLILGFRKEWLAEIDQRLAERRLPRGEVFLERLGRAGIVEVVAGPQATPQLAGHYRLGVEAGLPGLIADDLLADRESPVAPMLAILLADMWEAAKARSYDRPAFDADLYHEFRSRGLSLDDFVGRQLRALQGKQPELVDSGLALDVLAHHTTPLGTAEQRTLADLEREYSHRQEVLPALVQECRDLYLLVDPSRNRPGEPLASRLTHDTLAPHVRRRFDESNAPGQRARRILESRLTGEPAQTATPAPLGDADLETVLAGEVGMRARRAGEEALVTASLADAQRRADEQARTAADLTQQKSRAATRLRLLLAILTILALIAPGWWLRQQILKRQAAAAGPVACFNSATAIIGTDTDPTVDDFPQHTQSVDAFCIERFEVTNHQYRLCQSAQGCSPPIDRTAYADLARSNHPVVGITAFQADDYCRWLGRRLPTEVEWEYAARGTEGRLWPWGDTVPDATRTNLQFTEVADTLPVGSFSPRGDTTGSTPISDLVGNVWEWTATPDLEYPYDPDPQWREPLETWLTGSLIIRGGAFNFAVDSLPRISQRVGSEPSLAAKNTGFRCAYN